MGAQMGAQAHPIAVAQAQIYDDQIKAAVAGDLGGALPVRLLNDLDQRAQRRSHDLGVGRFVLDDQHPGAVDIVDINAGVFHDAELAGGFLAQAEFLHHQFEGGPASAPGPTTPCR